MKGCDKLVDVGRRQFLCGGRPELCGEAFVAAGKVCGVTKSK